MIKVSVERILSMWLGRAGPLHEITEAKMMQSYFARDENFDAECKTFESLIEELIEYYEKSHVLPSLQPFKAPEWETVKALPVNRDETLSHILLLDQFTRNIWRGADAARVYTVADPIAHQLSLYAMHKGWTSEATWLEFFFILYGSATWPF